jgi:hypothetical protein
MSFPIPDYDSGWVNIDQGEQKVLTHKLGGNADNYFVDMESKTRAGNYGIHQFNHGGEKWRSGNNYMYFGVFWLRLNTNSITVIRWKDDIRNDNIRIRIWKY